MSDREIIIKSLKKAERRLRANRLVGDLSFSLSLFLLFPLAFKIWDLFSPFRGVTVAVVLGAWAACFVLYFIWRTMQKGTLEQAAAQVDKKAALYDELKTAYWFINNPLASDWVDVQIRRAAKRASELNIDRLYPRVIPPTSYIAAGLLALLFGLNFVPLPWNHNWVYMQAAPAFSLTDAERVFLAEAQQLLEKTDQLDDTALSERIEEIMQELQEGETDLAEALKTLQEIQKLLGEANLDKDAIDKALDEIAEDFESSDQLKEAAQALRDMDLVDAAKEMKELSEELEAATAEQLKKMQESLENASENSEEVLRELSDDLESASEGLKEQDKEAAKEGLAKAAEFLKSLSKKIQSQELKGQANQELQNLSDSMQKRDSQSQEVSDAGEQKEPGQQGESQPGEEEPSSEDRRAVQSESQGTPDDNSENGTEEEAGLQPSGRSGNDAPVEGPPTKGLDVQLEQEKLTGQYDEEVKPEEIEQTSKQERSKLDYRNVPSELSAAQKDVLNQERIPWEYRPLIKNYFEAIRPPREDR